MILIMISIISIVTALSFDKESRKTLIASIPNRTEAALESLKDTMKANRRIIRKRKKLYYIFMDN